VVKGPTQVSPIFYQTHFRPLTLIQDFDSLLFSLSEITWCGIVTPESDVEAVNNKDIVIHGFKENKKGDLDAFMKAAKLIKRERYEEKLPKDSDFYIATLEDLLLKDYNNSLFHEELDAINVNNFHEVHIAFIKRPRRDKNLTAEFVLVSPHAFHIDYKTSKAIKKLAQDAEK